MWMEDGPFMRHVMQRLTNTNEFTAESRKCIINTNVIVVNHNLCPPRMNMWSYCKLSYLYCIQKYSTRVCGDIY